MINYDIRSCDLPAPQMVSKVIRSALHTLKKAVHAVPAAAMSFVRRLRQTRVDTEASAAGEKDSAENALSEYRQKLQDTFGAARRVEWGIRDVGYWTDGK